MGVPFPFSLFMTDNAQAQAKVGNPSKAVSVVVWGGLTLVILGLLGLFIQQGIPRQAPYPVIKQVRDFAFTNQLGEITTLDDLKGKVWVADVIFVRCGGPCPKLTQEMARLQAATGESVRFVTITTDPEHDTPALLKRYGERFGADHGRWHFLTSSKQAIAQLAVQDLLFTAMEKAEGEQEDPNDLFIHSTTFVIVDKKGRVRASVEALEEFGHDTALKIIKDLEREPDR